MGLENGSREYYDIVEHAERIYRKKANAKTTDDRRKWAEKGYDLMDRIREDYGYSDKEVKYIIERYSLDRE